MALRHLRHDAQPAGRQHRRHHRHACGPYRRGDHALYLARWQARRFRQSDTTVRLWNLETGETLATFLAINKGEWIILTPEGFYSASPNGRDLANVVSGFEAFPLQRFHQLLHRPDLVAEKIAGDPRGSVREAFAKLDPAAALAAARQAK